eukprot:Gb_25245 [translate_table: standard]
MPFFLASPSSLGCKKLLIFFAVRAYPTTSFCWGGPAIFLAVVAGYIFTFLWSHESLSPHSSSLLRDAVSVSTVSFLMPRFQSPTTGTLELTITVSPSSLMLRTQPQSPPKSRSSNSVWPFTQEPYGK